MEVIVVDNMKLRVRVWTDWDDAAALRSNDENMEEEEGASGEMGNKALRLFPANGEVVLVGTPY